MTKENWVQVEYLHKLTEDVGSIGATHIAGIVLTCTPTPQKLEYYSTFNGVGFDKIPPEKVKVYQRTTKHSVEETPVE